MATIPRAESEQFIPGKAAHREIFVRARRVRPWRRRLAIRRRARPRQGNELLSQLRRAVGQRPRGLPTRTGDAWMSPIALDWLRRRVGLDEGAKTANRNLVSIKSKLAHRSRIIG